MPAQHKKEDRFGLQRVGLHNAQETGGESTGTRISVARYAEGEGTREGNDAQTLRSLLVTCKLRSN